MKQTLRYYKQGNYYKGSNVAFYPKGYTAYSYGWWKFVALIKGQVIFNNYNYSNMTRKHQWKVHQLIDTLGIHIDRTVQVSEGLQGINTIGDLNRAEKETLKGLANRAESKRLARNARAKILRDKRKAMAAINKLTTFRSVVSNQL